MINGRDIRPLGIAVLGSTGSIGRQTLDVIDAHPDRFRIVSLAARSHSERFRAQIARYNPLIASISAPSCVDVVVAGECLSGIEGLIAAATHPDVEIVVVATSGHDAIEPTMRAIEHGKTIALANKETLVCAGELIIPLAQKHGVSIRPVDSEHSAIWQAIGNASTADIEQIIVTASGGPFRTWSAAALAGVTRHQALAHPTWSMGGKITVDSATLMNKGLEVIEAHWLFDISFDRINVVVHPESIVHSIVEFVDGSQIAQLGLPDMRLPIQYALTYPDRIERPGPRLQLADVGLLHFESPDEGRFPCLRLARESGTAGITYPTVLSAADDEAVSAFLDDRLRFIDIPAVVSHVLDLHLPEGPVTLESITSADRWAREVAKDRIAELEPR